MIPYKSPQHKERSFNCPHCSAFAHQVWCQGSFYKEGYQSSPEIYFCFCSHCGEYSLWRNGNMIYPDATGICPPNTDLSKEIQDDFNEARSIVNKSPRGATALLRLCIQKLCIQLGESGKDINKDIAALVKKGLPVQIQKSLDVVRVIGNESVHPGQIDLKDNIAIASKLF